MTLFADNFAGDPEFEAMLAKARAACARVDLPLRLAERPAKFSGHWAPLSGEFGGDPEFEAMRARAIAAARRFGLDRRDVAPAAPAAGLV